MFEDRLPVPIGLPLFPDITMLHGLLVRTVMVWQLHHRVSRAPSPALVFGVDGQLLDGTCSVPQYA